MSLTHDCGGSAGKRIAVLCATPCLVAALALPAHPSFKDCAECPQMVVVPGGRFVMGAAPDEEAREHLAEEFRHRSAPPRMVSVSRFAVGQFEVTRGEYRVFAEATRRASDGCFIWTGTQFELDPAKSWRDPGYAQTDSHPVTCVSWEDASAYASWLSQRTGRRYRLLSEAEWEYAVRAGTATARYWTDGTTASCEHANGADRSTAAHARYASNWPVAECDDGHPYTAPVGTFRANAFGLHDMLGNAAEWTQDCWNGNFRAAPVDGKSWNEGDCGMRAVRGGAWNDAPVGIRAAYRVGSPITVRVDSRGFRLAADL